MRNLNQILLCILSSTLFFLSWPPNGFPFLIFFSFIPLFKIIKNFSYQVKKANLKLFLILFFNFLLTNFLLCYWVIKTNVFGGIFASFYNAFFMALVLLLSSIIKKKYGEKHFYISLIIFWISIVEFPHLNWDFSWPWLILGNVFSNSIYLIQWYEYTGVFGGSLWILLSNVIIYNLIDQDSFKFNSGNFFKILVIILPVIFSQLIINFKNFKDLNINDSNNEIKISIVQPNFDCYTEKFQLSQDIQFDRVDSLINIDRNFNAKLTLLPENFLKKWMWESRLMEFKIINRIDSLLKKKPTMFLLTGATTAQIYKGKNKYKYSVRNKNNIFFEVFNSSILFSKNIPHQIYRKSKLIPGAETIPYPNIFSPIFDRFPIKIDNQIGNFGRNDSISNFYTDIGIFSSIICYESIYGEYVSKFVKKGANWITIITNDGWWGDSYGYSQHFAYSRLRALENRKFLVRSANTGISAVINPFGEILDSLSYNKSGIINTNIYKNSKITFYTMYGDYVARISILLSLVYFINFFINFKKKKLN